MSSHKKGTQLTSFHIRSFVVLHTDLQKNTIVTCILTSQDHIFFKCARSITSAYAINTILSCVLIFLITNEFIGEEFYPSQHSLDGYEAMGFDVSELTQDEEQCLFTLQTDIPIPMLVYWDSFQWAKYGHHILLSSLDLASNNKAGLHRTCWNSLIEFFHTDLDGNLSSSLNPLTASKLDHHLSRLL